MTDSLEWNKWLTECIDFSGVLDHVASDMASSTEPAYVIEMGSHPVLIGALENLKAGGVKVAAHAASMQRGVPAVAFLRTQRALLASAGLLKEPLAQALKAAKIELDLGKQGRVSTSS